MAAEIMVSARLVSYLSSNEIKFAISCDVGND